MSSPASSRLVWFLLTDSTTGQPYRGTTADCVSLLSSDNVAQFRKAVKVEYDQPDYLKYIPSGALLVYRNKAALDKRNDDEGKEMPLDEDSYIIDLGMSKKEALIVLVPPTALSTSSVDKPSVKRRHLMSSHNFLVDLKKDMAAPSSFAQHVNKGSWVTFLRKYPNMVICHRDRSEEPFIPVSLMNPIFSDFVQDLNCISITSHDCDFVSSLTHSMSGNFEKECDRTEAFSLLFGEYMGSHLVSINTHGSSTDGSYHFDDRSLYCNLEVKVEKGSGNGDPYMQSIAYYIQNLPTEAAAATQYPCFLLELCGTAFSVSGILNTQLCIVCDPLSPTYQLLCNQDFVNTLQITRLFASLRKGLRTLRDHGLSRLYKVSLFPFLKSFRDRDSKEEFKIDYQERIKDLLFSANVCGCEEEVIVKFCSKYNQDVHLFCHSIGFAPRLISCTRLGHYTVVVMQKLNLRDLIKDDIQNPHTQDQITDMVFNLKKMKYVHGDMRSCNILFDTIATRIVLVDFDWSGCDGSELYPPFMNPDIAWPEGASTGKPLRHEHDLYWLKLLFSEMTTAPCQRLSEFLS